MKPERKPWRDGEAGVGCDFCLHVSLVGIGVRGFRVAAGGLGLLRGLLGLDVAVDATGQHRVCVLGLDTDVKVVAGAEREA